MWLALATQAEIGSIAARRTRPATRWRLPV